MTHSRLLPSSIVTPSRFMSNEGAVENQRRDFITTYLQLTSGGPSHLKFKQRESKYVIRRIRPFRSELDQLFLCIFLLGNSTHNSGSPCFGWDSVAQTSRGPDKFINTIKNMAMNDIQLNPSWSREAPRVSCKNLFRDHGLRYSFFR